jgi:hypothetical protein
MSLAIPVLSLLIAALAVFFGPLVTLRISRRQNELSRQVASDQIELSRRVASKQIVAPMRQAWINNFRAKLAELSGRAEYLRNTGIKEPNDHTLLQLQEEITLLINPTEEDHKGLVAAIQRMLDGLEAGNADAFAKARQQTRVLAQTIFKTEWNRIKDDIEKP